MGGGWGRSRRKAAEGVGRGIAPRCRDPESGSGNPQGAPLWGADGGGSARKGAEGGGQGEREARGYLPASTRGGVKAPRQHRGREYEPRAERRRIRKRMAMRVEHSRETALLLL